MAVQHRGVDGDSDEMYVVDESPASLFWRGNEHIPKGMLPRLKSLLDGMSIHDFDAVLVAAAEVDVDILLKFLANNCNPLLWESLLLCNPIKLFAWCILQAAKLCVCKMKADVADNNDKEEVVVWWIDRMVMYWNSAE